MKALLQWIDDRTGVMSAWQDRRRAGIPREPGWLGVWPAAILFTFLVQAVTGFFLWMYYSPSAQTAWESLYFLQHEVAGGWLLRGMHYYAGQVLLVLIGAYVLTMVFSGTYRAPRELVFWLAVAMAAVAIALLLTGDLLSWSQRGYWSTDVRTKFLFLLPWVGGDLYKLAVGGPAMGHLTLTRFLALHAGLFSAVFAVLVVLHAAWARRAALQQASVAFRSAKATSSRGAEGQQNAAFAERKATLVDSRLHNALGCVAVMAAVLVLCCWGAFGGGHQGQLPGDYLGAELGSPPDPGDAYAAARPDWYFVGLYQFAHYFSGGWKIVPIFLVPALVVLVFLAMPLFAQWAVIARWAIGHWLNMAGTAGLIVGVVVLTLISKHQDANDPAHQASLAAAEQDAARVKELICAQGIPSGGALALLWEDPKTQGPKLFRQHCLSCHDHAGPDGSGMLAENPSAPNLHRFATKEWLAGLLDPKQIAYAPPRDPQTGKLRCTPTDRPRYFGGTERLVKGDMVDFVKGNLREVRKDVGEEEFRTMIATLAAEGSRRPGDKPSKEVKQAIGDFTCFDCHHFHGENTAPVGPDLTRYGSTQWLVEIISNPAAPRFYGMKNERMPAYAKTPESPENNILTRQQIGVLADWLRGEWYEPPASAE